MIPDRVYSIISSDCSSPATLLAVTKAFSEWIVVDLQLSYLNHQQTNGLSKQGNGRSHFVRVVHSRYPFPAIGDEAYRQRTGGGPSHGHRQHAQKFG